MQRSISRLALSILVPVAVTAGATAVEAQEAMAEACTASFSAEAVEVQTDPVMVSLTLSTSIGEIEAGAAAEESGLVVKEIASGEQGTAVYLDTSKGQAGEWKLTFKGSEGSCSGMLAVKTAQAVEENAPESGEG